MSTFIFTQNWTEDDKTGWHWFHFSNRIILKAILVLVQKKSLEVYGFDMISTLWGMVKKQNSGTINKYWMQNPFSTWERQLKSDSSPPLSIWNIGLDLWALIDPQQGQSPTQLAAIWAAKKDQFSLVVGAYYFHQMGSFTGLRWSWLIIIIDFVVSTRQWMKQTSCFQIWNLRKAVKILLNWQVRWSTKNHLFFWTVSYAIFGACT